MALVSLVSHNQYSLRETVGGLEAALVFLYVQGTEM